MNKISPIIAFRDSLGFSVPTFFILDEDKVILDLWSGFKEGRIKERLEKLYEANHEI